MITFQEMIRRLTNYWEKQGCIIHQPYDLETGAGTFNPATFLRCLGPEPYNAAYVEPCRRPTDGRYGENPNRTQHYFQYQTVLKPSPLNIQELYLKSLEAIGFDLSKHDVRFVHDDWESPTLGAWGLGWEVWMDGMEITQFTYFQSVGGFNLKPVMGEITYGLERLALYLQQVDSFFDLKWNEDLTYGDIYHHSEVEWSHYNFEEATVSMWHDHFDRYEVEAQKLIEKGLPFPAYDFVMKGSHAFNILDARGAISVTERTGYIARIRQLACSVAACFVESREKKGYPLLKDEQLPKPVGELSTPVPQKKDKEDFVLEIGSEELPASFVDIGCANLKKAIEKLLDKEGLTFTNLNVYGTPRRLAAYISDLSTSKPAVEKERKGPAVTAAFNDDGTPKKAAEGFFRSLQIETPSLDAIREGQITGVEIREVKGAQYLFAVVKAESRTTAEILAEALPKIIVGLDFPKKMRWSNLDLPYARPLHWIIALHGEHVIPFAVANIASGRTTEGHRQLQAGSFEIKKASDYVTTLKKHKVMVDIDERKELISEQLAKIEKEVDGHAVAKEKVLNEVVNLVEWPQLTYTPFSESFLTVPKEVLISEMVEHQKYFPIADDDGRLKNLFIITADNTPSDFIRDGNNKVLSARLSDGAFLFAQDCKVPLEEFNEKLKAMTFQKALGSVYDKVLRVAKHAEVLQKYFPGADSSKIQRTALLCKADLASEMVYEFPELQGVMGSTYANIGGEDKEVAQAIDEHWMPRGEKAPLPETMTGTILSLADKIDNIISCFATGLIPTSSSDPYALRRQLLGIIKMLLSGKHYLPFHEVFSHCLENFPQEVIKEEKEILDNIEGFTLNRIKTVFQDYNLSKDEVEASLSGGFADIYDIFCRAQALHSFREDDKLFSSLWEVYKRAKGQTADYEPQDFNQDLLKEEAEKSLATALNEIEKPFEKAIEGHKYDEGYALIAKIQPPLAKLFDEVRILDDDETIRNNRIALLQRVFALFIRLLDFSKIQLRACS